MRDWFIITAIFIIIVGGDIMMQTHLNKTADELINNLQDLKQKTILAKETENRENIKKQINEIDEKWEEINKTWAEIVVHQELDNIHQSLTKAKSNIEEGGLEDAIQEIETALFFVEHDKIVQMKEKCMEEIDKNNLPKHIAIIMDGNRRWAKQRNLTTKEGHKAGSKNLENIAIFCNEIGIKYLTVYAFSTENWKRTQEEVSALMFILKANLDSMLRKMDLKNIKIRVIGEKENIPKDIQAKIDKLVEKTKNNTGLVLNIAFNYGGRAELVHTTKVIAQKVKDGEISVEDIDELLISNNLYTAGQPDPDLMIRTSHELRTSNFLPWQLTYSEFYFPDKHWPEFGREDLIEAIKVYQKRNRRFGGRPDEVKK